MLVLEIMIVALTDKHINI